MRPSVSGTFLSTKTLGVGVFGSRCERPIRACPSRTGEAGVIIGAKINIKYTSELIYMHRMAESIT